MKKAYALRTRIPNPHTLGEPPADRLAHIRFIRIDKPRAFRGRTLSTALYEMIQTESNTSLLLNLSYRLQSKNQLRFIPFAFFKNFIQN